MARNPRRERTAEDMWGTVLPVEDLTVALERYTLISDENARRYIAGAITRREKKVKKKLTTEPKKPSRLVSTHDIKAAVSALREAKEVSARVEREFLAIMNAHYETVRYQKAMSDWKHQKVADECARLTATVAEHKEIIDALHAQKGGKPVSRVRVKR